MFYGLNWVDLVIIISLIFFTLEAIGRPLILEVLDLISFLLALFLSLRYYNLASKFLEINFQIPHGLALVLGFMAVWFISETIFFFLVRLVIPKIPKIKFLYIEYLAILPSFFRGLVFVSLTLVLLATFPIQPAVKIAVLESKIGSQILKQVTGLEQPVKNVFGGITNDTLTFLTIKPSSDERVNLGFQTTDTRVDDESERKMIDLVNEERFRVGRKPLEFDASLRNIGRAHSKDMFKRGYFSHYSPAAKTVADRAGETGIDFLVIGENLAYAPDVNLAHKGLMNSQGHKENILSEDYGKVGIGVIDGGVYGKMFTQVFSN